MKTNKKLNNQELDNVSGGKTNLDDYLKTIAGKGKNKILVGYGTGVELSNNSKIDHEENNNLIVIKREKKLPEEQADLSLKQ